MQAKGTAGASGEAGPRRIVLPRPLARALRAVARRDWRLPRHAGLKGLALLFSATAITGIVASERVEATLDQLSSASGLSIESVKITGQSETSEVAVLDKLELTPEASLPMLDVAAARARIETLAWVERATLRKIYPSTLKIDIEERKPFALWQRDSVLSVIDDTGRVITDTADWNYGGLLRVVGKGANERVHEAFDLVAGLPEIGARVKAAVLVAERRWNLVLDNDVTLMLPQENAKAAIATLVALDERSNLLSRDISAIDLRMNDRMFVRLTPEAAKRREAELKEREKLAKRRGAST